MLKGELCNSLVELGWKRATTEHDTIIPVDVYGPETSALNYCEHKSGK